MSRKRQRVDVGHTYRGGRSEAHGVRVVERSSNQVNEDGRYCAERYQHTRVHTRGLNAPHNKTTRH